MMREIKREVGLMMTQVNAVVPAELRALPSRGRLGSPK
jgi:hypothetical protein